MKRKTLTTAIVAGLTGVAGMVGVANAVNINPDGLGQVLIYPYYSARGGNDTLISVVNTTTDAKAVKVRFLEALNSREVLDFNLYLSAFDVWTAAVTDIDDGTPGIVTADTSCTVPYFFGNTDGVQNFLPFGFQGNLDDDGPQGLERTASGYIEVIEMGTLFDTEVELDTGEVDEDGNAITFTPTPATAATHTEDGVPADCQELIDAWSLPVSDGAIDLGPENYWLAAGADTGVGAPSGGLFGAASIINVAGGTMFSYNPTPISNFSVVELHSNPGTLTPDLDDVNQEDAAGNPVNRSNVFVEGSPSVLVSDWQTGVEAVSAVLTKDAIYNEYVLGGIATARSEWVVTLPTKRFYADDAFSTDVFGQDAPVAPFTAAWEAEQEDQLDEDGDPILDDDGNVVQEPLRSTAGACESVDTARWNREEGPIAGEGPSFVIPPVVSPVPSFPDDPDPEDPGFQLCFEANVVRYAVEDEEIPDVAEITKEPRFTTLTPGPTEGWVRFDFDNVSRATTDGSTVLNGLPVVGFLVNTFSNGAIVDENGVNVLSNYGGTFEHRGSRSIGVPDTAQ